MHTINIFLASSLSELQEERNELQKYLSGADLRGLFQEDNTDITVVRCEDVSHGYAGTRLQKVLNNKLKECQISIFLFKDDVREGTEEEFNVAFDVANRKAKGKAGKHTMFVYVLGDSKIVEDKIKKLSDGKIYEKRCNNIHEVGSSFIIELLKYERELLVTFGERYIKNKDCSAPKNPEFETYKKEGDGFFSEYKWHQERQKVLQIEIHRTIEQILLRIESNKSRNSNSFTIGELEIYFIINNWAHETGYNKEKHCRFMTDYVNLLTQKKQNEDAKSVCKDLIQLVEEVFDKDSTKSELAASYCSIGQIYYQMKDHLNALKYYEKAYEIQKLIMGDMEPIRQSTKVMIDTIKNDLSKSGGEKKIILANAKMSI